MSGYTELQRVVWPRLRRHIGPVIDRGIARVVSGGVTTLGIGLVGAGCAVWLSRYVPVWGVLIGGGLMCLLVVYSTERGERVRPAASGPSAVTSTGGAQEREAPHHHVYREAVGERIAALNGSGVPLHASAKASDGAPPVVGGGAFALGALIGIECMRWCLEIRSREKR